MFVHKDLKHGSADCQGMLLKLVSACQGGLAPAFPLLFHNYLVSQPFVIAIPNNVFLPNPACPNFGESRNQIPYPVNVS